MSWPSIIGVHSSTIADATRHTSITRDTRKSSIHDGLDPTHFARKHTKYRRKKCHSPRDSFSAALRPVWKLRNPTVATGAAAVIRNAGAVVAARRIDFVRMTARRLARYDIVAWFSAIKGVCCCWRGLSSPAPKLGAARGDLQADETGK